MQLVTIVRPWRSKNVWFFVFRRENFNPHLNPGLLIRRERGPASGLTPATFLSSDKRRSWCDSRKRPPLARYLFLLLRRRCRFRRFGGIVPARQISGLHADIAFGHVVILGLRHSLKIFIKPSHDVLQALHAVPRLA